MVKCTTTYEQKVDKKTETPDFLIQYNKIIFPINAFVYPERFHTYSYVETAEQPQSDLMAAGHPGGLAALSLSPPAFILVVVYMSVDAQGRT